MAADKPAPGQYKYVAKSRLSELFERYDRALPVFPRLPVHARIAVDVLGIRKAGDGIETFQLEAALFEDMAALWNASQRTISALTPASSALQFKESKALLRSTVKAAFNLVEGYLNGLACDVRALRSVSERHRALLEEVDAASGRPRTLSLREKALQYPKIACGVDEPPIVESNCSELEELLEAERIFRHALIHPTPRLAPERDPVPREVIFLALE